MGATSQDLSDDKADRPLIEWVFGAISGVLVAALLLFLAYEALLATAQPPELVITMENAQVGDNATTVTVAAANRGDEAAAGVIVYAAHDGARKQIEFDYIAAHAVRRGVFVFPAGIPVEQLVLEVGGFTEP